MPGIPVKPLEKTIARGSGSVDGYKRIQIEEE